MGYGRKTGRLALMLLAVLMTFRPAAAAEAQNDWEKTYFNSDYQWLEDEDSVYRSVTWEELTVLLQQEGNYLILLGGPWCTNTTPVIGYIDEVAKEYGVSAIYTFDLRLDGATADAHIRESNGASKNGKDVTGSHYNYLYGELAARYLTNLNDYVEYTLDTEDALTYTDAEGQDVTVPKLQVPFLFLYNKDNKTENGTAAPIVTALELMMEREDFLYVDESVDEEQVDAYKEILRETVFETVAGVELSAFTDADYIREIYNEKAGEEIFGEADQINIDVVSYRQFQWLLKQEDEYLILFGGAWDEEARENIAAVNDYAVENDVTVYNFDPALDGGYAAEYWGYTKSLNISDSENEFFRLYADLTEDYLYGAADVENVTYTDTDGNTSDVAVLPTPYLFTYSRNELDENGHKIAVVTAVELDETAEPESGTETAETETAEPESGTETAETETAGPESETEAAEPESGTETAETETAEPESGTETAETETAEPESETETAETEEAGASVSTMVSREIAALVMIAVVAVTLAAVRVKEKKKASR